MDSEIPQVDLDPVHGGEPIPQPEKLSDEVVKLRSDFESRLVTANLRTEAVRAGMIDLDGLKLVDRSALLLDEDDKIVGGRELMTDLRRNKPWLFNAASSSSAATAPASQPPRPKMAIDMTEEEYAAARNAVTKYKF
jgi:hypothetical protein